MELKMEVTKLSHEAKKTAYKEMRDFLKKKGYTNLECMNNDTILANDGFIRQAKHTVATYDKDNNKWVFLWDKTVYVEASIALTEKARMEKFGSQTSNPFVTRNEHQHVYLKIPIEYTSLVTMWDENSTPRLDVLMLDKIDSKELFYRADDLAELENGALYFQRWEAAKEKVPQENLEFVKKFADHLASLNNELNTFIDNQSIEQKISDIESNAAEVDTRYKIERDTFLTLDDLIKECEKLSVNEFSRTYKLLIQCFFENKLYYELFGARQGNDGRTTIPFYEEHVGSFKNESWFISLLENLSDLRDKLREKRHSYELQIDFLNNKGIFKPFPEEPI